MKSLLQKIIKYIRNSYFKGYFPSLYKLLFSRKNVIVYYGFLGDGNFGDNLVFEATKKLFNNYTVLTLQRRMPIFTLLLYKYYLKNRVKGVIIGGGTLIGESFFMKDEFLNLINRNLPVFFHGTGINEKKELNPAWSILMQNELFGGLRGPLSIGKFTLDFNKNIDKIGDAAFLLLNKPFLNRTDKLRQNSKKVLINLGTHLPYLNEEIFRKELDSFIEYLLLEGYTIQFVALHTIDQKMGKVLKAKFPQIEIITIESSYKKAEEIFSNACFAIGERMHFAVMALMVDCPVYTLIYEQKHLDLLESISLKHLGVNPSNVSFNNILVRFINRESQYGTAINNINAYKNKQLESIHAFERAMNS